MKEIKHLFMTYRNGVVADALRRAFMQQASQTGEEMPYHVIFGLNLPQLSEIARSVGEERRASLARELWQDRKVRESRLLACYLTEPLALSVEDALEMVRDLQTAEEADILCMRVLSRHPQRARLVVGIGDIGGRYASRCLMRLAGE